MSAFHGSDIEKIAAVHQISPDNLINFGVNANPLKLSDNVKKALRENIELITDYPDPSYAKLKHAISHYLSVDFERILPCNGTSELIHQIIQSFAPKKAMLYTPTYSEYAREVKKVGGEVLPLALTPQNKFQFPTEDFYRFLPEAELILLCNPNNPTATALKTAELFPLIKSAKENGSLFVLDETYVEFTDRPEDYSAVALLPKFDNLIILRGFSKFFSAPGLRLGYGLFGNLQYLKQFQNTYPWGIHSLAAFAGELMLGDKEYIQASHQYLKKERDRILSYLKQIPDLTVYPTEINFFLLQLGKKSATDLFLFLLKEGFLIRNFHDEIGEGFFRFCIMEEENNTALLHAIERFIHM